MTKENNFLNLCIPQEPQVSNRSESFFHETDWRFFFLLVQFVDVLSLEYKTRKKIGEDLVVSNFILKIRNLSNILI